jgi:hypothetical protein
VQNVVDVFTVRSVLSESRIVRILRRFRQRHVDDTPVPVGQYRDRAAECAVVPVGWLHWIGDVLAGHVRHDHIPPFLRIQSAIRRQVDVGGMPVRWILEQSLVDLPSHWNVRLRLHAEGWEHGRVPAMMYILVDRGAHVIVYRE